MISGALRAEDIGTRRDELEAEETALKQQLSDLMRDDVGLQLSAELTRKLLTPGKVSFSDAVAAKKELRTRWAELSHEEQRTLIKDLGEMRVMPGRAANRIKFPNLQSDEEAA